MTTDLSAVQQLYDADIQKWVATLQRIAEATGAEWSTSRSFANLMRRLSDQQRQYREAFQADERPELPAQPRHQHEAKLRLTTEVREALINIGRLLDALVNAREAQETGDTDEYAACMREAATSHRIVAELMANIETMFQVANFGASGGAEFRYEIDDDKLVDLFQAQVAKDANQTHAVQRLIDQDRIGLSPTAIVTRLQKRGVWKARKR